MMHNARTRYARSRNRLLTSVALTIASTQANLTAHGQAEIPEIQIINNAMRTEFDFKWYETIMTRQIQAHLKPHVDLVTSNHGKNAYAIHQQAEAAIAAGISNPGTIVCHSCAAGGGECDAAVMSRIFPHANVYGTNSGRVLLNGLAQVGWAPEEVANQGTLAMLKNLQVANEAFGLYRNGEFVRPAQLSEVYEPGVLEPSQTFGITHPWATMSPSNEWLLRTGLTTMVNAEINLPRLYPALRDLARPGGRTLYALSHPTGVSDVGIYGRRLGSAVIGAYVGQVIDTQCGGDGRIGGYVGGGLGVGLMQKSLSKGLSQTFRGAPYLYLAEQAITPTEESSLHQILHDSEGNDRLMQSILRPFEMAIDCASGTALDVCGYGRGPAHWTRVQNMIVPDNKTEQQLGYRPWW